MSIFCAGEHIGAEELTPSLTVFICRLSKVRSLAGIKERPRETDPPHLRGVLFIVSPLNFFAKTTFAPIARRSR